MKITVKGIRFPKKGDTALRRDPRTRAVASVVLDDAFIINEIRVCQGRHRLCVVFAENPYPIHVDRPEYVVVPTTMEVRRQIEDVVLSRYYAAIKTRVQAAD